MRKPINDNPLYDTINNDAYNHSCNCPVCQNKLSRNLDENVFYCKFCGSKLHTPSFSEEEINQAIFEREQDEFED